MSNTKQELEELEDSSSDTNTVVEIERNKDAARALFRVKQKLDGYEEGEMRSLKGQVGCKRRPPNFVLVIIQELT
jgi:ataxia telangiectasia mutated family protein